MGAEPFVGFAVGVGAEAEFAVLGEPGDFGQSVGVGKQGIETEKGLVIESAGDAESGEDKNLLCAGEELGGAQEKYKLGEQEAAPAEIVIRDDAGAGETCRR